MTTKCLATNRSGERCSFTNGVISGYCHRHTYYRFLDENEKAKITRCSNCKLFSYLETKCLSCKIEQCYAIMKNNNRCTFTSNLANKSQKDERTFYCKTHCDWNDFGIDNGNGFDLQYVLGHVKKCMTCKKYFDKKSNSSKCENCQNYVRPTKQKKDIVKCNYDGCSSKAKQDGVLFYELFCGRHSGEAWKMECNSKQKKECTNYIRGCREMIDLNGKQKCEKCLNNCRILDRKRRNGLKTNFDENPSQPVVEDDLSSDLVLCKGINNKRTTCKYKPENNQEYCKYHLNQATLDERGMKLCTNCNKEFPKTNIKNSCEKCLQEGIKKNNNRDIQSERFAYKATKRNKECCLSTEYITKTSFSPCFYCGEQAQDGEKNGLDRVDNNVDYLSDNIVSCCATCNRMKHVHTQENFIKMTEHIATLNNLVENGELHPEAFTNHYGQISSNKIFHSYKIKAQKRNYEFSLSYYDFASKRNNNCYLCGKENSHEHKNGLDRVHNNVGYLMDNVEACCGNCNLLKGVKTLEETLEKCRQISNYQKNNKKSDNQSSEDIDNKVLVKIQIEKENKEMGYKCWANKVPFMGCNSRIRILKHFCHIHDYLSEYSDEQLLQLTKCNVCYKFGIINGTCCNECNETKCSEKNCLYMCENQNTICEIHKGTYNMCKAYTFHEGICHNKCSLTSDFCSFHKYWSNFTLEEQHQFIECNICLNYHLPEKCVVL